MSLTINDLTVLIATKPVVKDVSLSVAPGKVTAIIGANGAGKSELVLAAAGMLHVSKGHRLSAHLEWQHSLPT
jgi:branched-chain amino acid transport system ATP-binding protein